MVREAKLLFPLPDRLNSLAKGSDRRNLMLRFTKSSMSDPPMSASKVT